MMTAHELTGYLHRHIPLTAALDARVLQCGPREVMIHAPLAANLNHRGTAFGGSLATLGILSGWTVLHLALLDAGKQAQLVIQSSSTDFSDPVHADFTALSRLAEHDWERFLRMLDRYGRARISVGSEIRSGERLAVRHEGAFVAVLHDPPERVAVDA